MASGYCEIWPMTEAVLPPFDRPDRDFNGIEGWTWIGTYGGYYLQCDLLSSFEHGFFTRLWPGRGPAELVGMISSGVSVHRPQQVHGGLVLPASAASQEPWPDADGLVSDGAGQSLWVCGADCAPVLLADQASGRVAACHAGWRGVAAGILAEAIQQLEQRGSNRANLMVALGPAVSGRCYQVERSVSEQLGEIETLKLAGALLPDPTPDRDRLDIRRAAMLQLQQLGLTAEQLSSCPLCTVSEPELFHSWRRDQVKAVQWSGIVSQAA
jgi:YfiH family protein